MVTIKKIGKEYFLCKKKRGVYKKNKNKWTPIFWVKSSWYKSPSRFLIGNNCAVSCPQELFGKKIMLKVIIIEEK